MGSSCTEVPATEARIGNRAASFSLHEADEFIRQSYLRGHLAPAFTPPSKECTHCRRTYTGLNELCIKCLREKYTQDKAKEEVHDSFLEECRRCNKPTLHLGLEWCVECSAVPSEEFSLYCDQCDIVFELPLFVKDKAGKIVDMLKVKNLWCIKCSGVAGSWLRLLEDE
ncbi:hypothetical protein BKA56DRAFT_715656 [Ilyonectria sp. MPI-CAGE-AT-0026]|nr:hypothetical protein BKA56DRAFT_715656 [Ilyonectria sp. MPI-CAGE-AT-0026]